MSGCNCPEVYLPLATSHFICVNTECSTRQFPVDLTGVCEE